MNEKDESVNFQHEFGPAPHDLKIRIGLNIFKLHRSVAAAKSHYLNKLIQNHAPSYFTESSLDGIPADVLSIICQWMYTGRLKIRPNNLSTIWSAAKKLGIPEIVRQCQQFLQQVETKHQKSSVKRNGKADRILLDGTTTVEKEWIVNKVERPARNKLSLSSRVSEQETSCQGPKEVTKDCNSVPSSQLNNEKNLNSLPRKICKSRTENDKVILKTLDHDNLWFLMDRFQLMSKSQFLQKTLEDPLMNFIMVHCSHSQVLAQFLHWVTECTNVLTLSNLREFLQLTTTLEMAEHEQACLQFWKEKILASQALLIKDQATFNSISAQLALNCPLLGPYPFLFNLVQEQMVNAKVAISQHKMHVKTQDYTSSVSQPVFPYFLQVQQRRKLRIPHYDLSQSPPQLKTKAHSSTNIGRSRKSLEILKFYKKHSNKHQVDDQNLTPNATTTTAIKTIDSSSGTNEIQPKSKSTTPVG